MKKANWILFGVILLITALAVIAVWPTGPNLKIGKWEKELKFHRGLDLQGGTHLVYELDTSKIEEKNKADAVQSVVDVIDRRVNALGLSEPIIQSTNIENKPSVIVELPGISNVEEAINLIGKTAQLSFWESTGNPEDQASQSWMPTALSGANLLRAEVVYDPTTNNPQISIEFNDEGKKIFADLTQKNISKPLAIVLDNQMISAPTVQTAITDGKAVISGQFTISEAKDLAKLLNAGALPVPINIVSQQNIEASLGKDAVKQSLVAGLIGILLVALFMIVYYRFTGLIAAAALIIYSFIVLAIFKLLPVTLTLAGIAGFILSIGMAVDANVLIFERLKEELLEGKTIGAAIEDGFARAWPSVRDSNFSTLLTCLILYFTTSGMVKGFAITLIIGILISMFSAITVTRNFLRLISNTKLSKFIKWGYL